MFWLQMMSWILLVGFQVNASIDAIKLKSIRDKLLVPEEEKVN